MAERREDIPLLADSFLKRVAGESGFKLMPDAIQMLKQRDYSGNIRELRNLIERATILADGKRIGAYDFDFEEPFPALPDNSSASAAAAFVIEQPVPLDEVERRYLSWAASVVNGDRTALAERHKLSRRTLFRK